METTFLCKIPGDENDSLTMLELFCVQDRWSYEMHQDFVEICLKMRRTCILLLDELASYDPVDLGLNTCFDKKKKRIIRHYKL
ncbi:hypothetical protein AVEN_81442-1 [Araneus ventricosus]|uniref:Uncharacterized protein n=1 Tax=Araneus ventricosus TaxID=182803 RepID=A0A4Y2S8W3_ARAVE|nr:hypothetical protein AVEN_81442-1 [Araneus ventricosus]